MRVPRHLVLVTPRNRCREIEILLAREPHVGDLVEAEVVRDEALEMRVDDELELFAGDLVGREDVGWQKGRASMIKKRIRPLMADLQGGPLKAHCWTLRLQTAWQTGSYRTWASQQRGQVGGSMIR